MAAGPGRNTKHHDHGSSSCFPSVASCQVTGKLPTPSSWVRRTYRAIDGWRDGGTAFSRLVSRIRARSSTIGNRDADSIRSSRSVQGVIPGRKRQHYPDSPSAVGHVGHVGHVIPRAGEGSRPCPAPERRPPHPVQISDRSPLLKCVADSAPQHELLNGRSTTCSGSCSTRSRSRSARTCSRPDGSSPARRLKSSASRWQPKHPATANSAVRSRVAITISAVRVVRRLVRSGSSCTGGRRGRGRARCRGR